MPSKFGEHQKRQRINNWRVFEIFALGDTASLTAWTSYNRQQANFGICYVVLCSCTSLQSRTTECRAAPGILLF